MDQLIGWINGLSGDWFQFFLDASLQLTIFSVLVFGLSYLFRKRSAKFLFGLWSLVLLKAFIPPSVFFPIESQPVVIPTIILPLVTVESSVNSFVPTSPELSLTSYLFLGWLLICAALLFFVLYKNLIFRKKILSTSPVDENALPSSIQNQIKENNILVLRTEYKHSPFTWNFIKPKIYLPQDSIDWDTEQLEAILLHELAHIKRRDLWFNLPQTLCQIIYFFHPLVWLTNWQLGNLRERACDDFVISKSNKHALDYSKVLLNQIDQSLSLRRIPPLVNYFHQNKWSIKKRFEYLINRKEEIMLRLKKNEIVILSVICCTAMLFSFLSCGESDSNKFPQAPETLKMSGTDNTVFRKYDKAPEPIGGFSAIQNNLEYPELARRAGIQGQVIVHILIDSLGNVTDSKVLRSLGDNGCDEAAVAALTKTEWEPAQMKGERISVWVSVPVIFKLKEQAANMSSIRGTVTDNSGQPVKGAIVFVEKHDNILRAGTDESGKFTILNIPPGEHKLLCGFPNPEKQKEFFARVEKLRKNDKPEESMKLMMEGRATGKHMGLEKVVIKTLSMSKDQETSVNFALKE